MFFEFGQEGSFMFHFISYTEDGIPSRQSRSEAGDANLVSEFVEYQATETWRAALINGLPTASLKTVGALLQMCQHHGDFGFVEVTYRDRKSGKSMREMVMLHAINEWLKFTMEAYAPGKPDSEIMQALKIFPGEYLTVTYRLVSICELTLEPGPSQEYAEPLLPVGTRRW